MSATLLGAGAFIVVAAAATLTRAVVLAGQAPGIPWRTLGLNCAGAFALGVVVTAPWWTDPWVATTAGLGSLTTFSTVTAEISGLLDDGEKRLAMAYLGLTLVAGIAAAWLGLALGESFI